MIKRTDSLRWSIVEISMKPKGKHSISRWPCRSGDPIYALVPAEAGPMKRAVVGDAFVAWTKFSLPGFRGADAFWADAWGLGLGRTLTFASAR